MISTKGRYAIRFMIDLAETYEDLPVSLENIALRQDISKKYLESVVQLLVKANLIKGTSGKRGGYQLLRKPSEYTVGEILKVTESSMATVACLEDDAEVCPRSSSCKTLPMWKKYNLMVHDFFDHITIEDLVKGNV